MLFMASIQTNIWNESFIFFIILKIWKKNDIFYNVCICMLWFQQHFNKHWSNALTHEKKKIHIYFFVWTNCLGMLLWFIVFLLCPPKKAAYSICTVGLYICFSQQMWGCAKCPATFITLPFMDFFFKLDTNVKHHKCGT